MAADSFTERRARTRYPIELVVQYRAVQSRGASQPGIGMTVDFSSQGFLVSAAPSQIPRPGSSVRVVVEWPVHLDGKTPLQFVVRGKVVRTGVSTFALRFKHYEFLTRKRRRGS